MTDTVLVVDDTPSKRYVLASWLRRGGFAVLEASTGAEAIDIVGRGGIDLVVLDVRLPDVSGFEVCEKIKSDPVYGTTPVIHVSAAAVHSDDRAQGLQRGADAYLVEPIDPDELLATTTSILRYYQARKQAETLAARLESLARTTLVMSAATSQTGVLAEAAMGLARIFAAPVAIAVPADDGGRIVATCAGPGQRALVRPAAAYAGNEPVGISLADHPTERWPQVAWPPGARLRALALRPRIDRPQLYVVVPISSTVPGDPVLTLFAQGLASALESMRNFDREHDLALTLQRSLLPPTVPTLPGYDVAVRYVPASEVAEIGGDFYEVVRFDGTGMIAVGDVGGHSLHAATVMAELRHATRAYLADEPSPAAVLDRVNRLMCRLMPGETATMCLMAVDLADGSVRLANAGHPPPLLRTADGVRPIVEHSPLLGVQIRPATETRLRLDPGDVLVLYTDGLIELRTETIDVSLARLATVAADLEADLEEYASRLLREVGPAEPADDVAMVVVRRVADPGRPDIDVECPIDLTTLGRARAEVAGYCAAHGLPGETAQDFVLAANELATNVIRHGGGSGRMRLWHVAGTVYCQVSDHGPGMAPVTDRPVAPRSSAADGRGLWMVRLMTGSVDVDTGPAGTTITITASKGRADA